MSATGISVHHRGKRYVWRPYMPSGVPCVSCGARQVRVMQSRTVTADDGSVAIVRRRRCGACGHLMRSIEVIE